MKKILFGSVITIFAFAVLFGHISYQQADASVQSGTSYKSYIATSTANLQIVRGGSGLLGSIIIASSSASTAGLLPFRVYDAQAATSTATSTLIIQIRPGVTEQTITLDREILRGIVLDVPPAFNGNYVITHR